MFKVGDRVRIREDALHMVSSYQFKALGYERAIGRVRRISSRFIFVDFKQQKNSRVFGDKARMKGLANQMTQSRFGSFPIGGFLPLVLEKVER